MTRNNFILTSLSHKLLRVIYQICKGYNLEGKRSIYPQFWQKPMTAIAASQLFHPEVVPTALTRTVPKSKASFHLHFKTCQRTYTHTLPKFQWYFSNNRFAPKIHQKKLPHKMLEELKIKNSKVYLTQIV